jgi:hypothetical protein
MDRGDSRTQGLGQDLGADQVVVAVDPAGGEDAAVAPMTISVDGR